MTITVDLAGRRALITGASSDGFGAHFARTLARNGAEVVVAARRKPALDRLVAEIIAAGGRASAVAIDVTDAASVRVGVAAAGRVDILVNNAGIARTGAFLDDGEADFDAVMATNLKGAWLVAAAVARGMRAAGTGGAIINIASITGLRPAAGLAAYGASKAGVIHMTQQMAMELARDGIRVNAIAPGYFVTDMNRAELKSEHGQKLAKRVAMRRFGALPEIEGPLLLLASDASSFMTGSVIAVDGGHLAASL
jgi:NAD(P)-dependent dehydrogenase (short-subunit alcohol dehydrogenase family)